MWPHILLRTGRLYTHFYFFIGTVTQHLLIQFRPTHEIFAFTKQSLRRWCNHTGRLPPGSMLSLNRMIVWLVESVPTMFKTGIFGKCMWFRRAYSVQMTTNWVTFESSSTVENITVTHWFSKSKDIYCWEQAKQEHGRFLSVVSFCCSVSCGCLCHTWQICSDPKPDATLSVSCSTAHVAKHLKHKQSTGFHLNPLLPFSHVHLFLIPYSCLCWGISPVYLSP